ncbi:penicillin-binding protein 1C [Pelomonas sp. CA6]|uniref:penicillin-binding protein 1C n=1 Tax=Pelomonas sp. CA6 TaxID=2907999 RepID=UPI001F4BF754|nr:penicillin-binding protein 1C [Pelomonas sp. CA6]MCH7345880.1 penicillin-binding protein 1C [Pelomonas sp. CA6]
MSRAWWARAALLLAGALGPGLARAEELPSFASVKVAHPVSDRVLLDRRGEALQMLRVRLDQRVLPWEPLARMSPALLRAMLLSEDQRFYEHSGVDWSAVAASAWGNLWNQRTRGASTVTMQLAGLLHEDLAQRGGGRSWGQKLSQAWVASRLERRWSKAEILEAYLNRVPLRGELVGVPAAAQTLFGKSPAGLDARESALLAAMLRAPNAKPAQLAPRACQVLRLMSAPESVNCSGLEMEIGAVLQRRPAPPPAALQWAPHYARLALRGDAGQPTGAEQRSSLDGRLQRFAVQALRRHLAELSGRNVEDGAIVVLDNASGEVLAWVGSSGSQLSSAAEVDGVLARRQPGSTLKPFVYELALERRLITAASLLDDSPAQVQTGSGVYLPQNYDKRYRGWVSARAALGNSLNIPVVRLSLQLGPEALFERLNQLGLALPETGGYYGHSLALGSADVSLLALTNAYRALANGGLYGEVRLPSSAARAGAPRRVTQAGATHIVTEMLADNNARALSFGLDNALALPFAAAAKTGTSKDMRDNWCLGYSARYTVGVWVGNASGEPMHNVLGVSGAAPIWHELMLALHGGRAPQPSAAAGAGFLRPVGVVEREVRFENPAGVAEPARRELFLAGTELSLVRAQEPLLAIANPRDGAIYALDPDIPPQAQRLRFALQGRAEPGMSWRLNGRRIAAVSREGSLDWLPMPGRHRLALVDARGQVRQELGFEVRGAQLREPAGATKPAPALSPRAAARPASPG